MLSNTVQLQADITSESAVEWNMYGDRVITDTGYFGGTVDYYEATNHIPPTRTHFLSGGAAGTPRTISCSGADYAQFHPDRARYRWLHLECGQHDFYVNPAPQPGSRGFCPSPSTWVSRGLRCANSSLRSVLIAIWI